MQMVLRVGLALKNVFYSRKVKLFLGGLPIIIHKYCLGPRTQIDEERRKPHRTDRRDMPQARMKERLKIYLEATR